VGWHFQTAKVVGPALPNPQKSGTVTGWGGFARRVKSIFIFNKKICLIIHECSIFCLFKK
jgi:hypothetical protein